MTEDSLTKFYDKGWQHWNEFVRYYPASIHRRKFIVNEIKKINNWSTLADFGCGNGILLYTILKELYSSNKSFYGIDVSKEQIERNKQDFENIEFEHIDIGKQAPNQKFDIITCSEVIEHVPDHHQAMKNIVDSLNPGGTCIITVPRGEIFYTEQNFGHLRHYLPEDLVEPLEKLGLVTKKCYSWGFPFHDLSKYIANLNPKLSLQKFADGDLSPRAKLIFQLVNFLYYFNVLPFGKQIFYVGQKI